MTIAKTGNRAQYTGDGSTVAFAYAFRFFDVTDLGVYTLTAGVEAKKVLTTDYTVTNTGTEDGGTVTFLTAPATGVIVTILGEIPFTQVADYEANDPFPALTHETALDRNVRLVQQTQEEIGRSIKVPISSTVTSVTTDLPAANRALVWNDAATALTNGPTASEIENANADAIAAAASAAAADASAIAAAASAASIDPSAFATAAQGLLADTAVQPADLADVATSGAYADLTGVPVALTQGQVEDPASTTTGLATGQRIAQAIDARLTVNRVIASGDFATSSAVDIPLSGAFSAVRVVIEITAASVADAGLSARFTRDNFSAVISGASDYRWQTVEHVASTTLLNDDPADAQMQIITAGSNLGLDDTGPNAMIDIEIEGYANSVTLKQVLGKSTHIDQLSRSHLGMFSGRVIDASAANAINGIRLIPTSGNITGRWRVVSA